MGWLPKVVRKIHRDIFHPVLILPKNFQMGVNPKIGVILPPKMDGLFISWKTLLKFHGFGGGVWFYSPYFWFNTQMKPTNLDSPFSHFAARDEVAPAFRGLAWYGICPRPWEIHVKIDEAVTDGNQEKIWKKESYIFRLGHVYPPKFRTSFPFQINFLPTKWRWNGCIWKVPKFGRWPLFFHFEIGTLHTTNSIPQANQGNFASFSLGGKWWENS